MPERGLNSKEKFSSDLFSEIRPNQQGMLDVDARHSLYWEESGNPNGIPVVFLHGGPGAGTGASHRRFFDPAAYRIILFDQRGAGRSTPYAEVTDNTTDHLIEDIEALRRRLDVEQWLVFGGSWGATLAVVYAARFADRCLGLILRGVFLGRQHELDWFFGGVRSVFPDVWERFVGYLPEHERGDVLAAYHHRLMNQASDIHGPAARSWNAFESACSTFRSPVRAAMASNPVAIQGSPSLSLARIEAHYFVNDMFLEAELLSQVPNFRHLPGMIVQGRYDMVCPLQTAWELHSAWPGSVLEVIDDAGHSAMEPGIRRALVGATEMFKNDGVFDGG
jgi:proline iminopeptidase